MPRVSQGAGITSSVYNLIAAEDQKAAQRFKSSFVAVGETPEQEIVALNKYWRLQLGGVHANTISERMCLIDEINPADWMRHFRVHVLPSILRFNLPVVG